MDRTSENKELKLQSKRRNDKFILSSTEITSSEQTEFLVLYS
jgi:hypothetical protein